MKVIFIKPHLDWNPGDEADLDEGIACYLLHAGVVTLEQVDNEAIEKVLVKKLKAAKSEQVEKSEKTVKTERPEEKTVHKVVKKAVKKAVKKKA